MRFLSFLLISILLSLSVLARPKPTSCDSYESAKYFIPEDQQHTDWQAEEDLFTWHFGFTVCLFEWGGECQQSLEYVSAIVEKATCDIISLECTTQGAPSGERCQSFEDAPTEDGKQ